MDEEAVLFLWFLLGIPLGLCIIGSCGREPSVTPVYAPTPTVSPTERVDSLEARLQRLETSVQAVRELLWELEQR